MIYHQTFSKIVKIYSLSGTYFLERWVDIIPENWKFHRMCAKK